MTYDLFVEKFPELGWKETRSATVFPSNSYELPADEYGLIEAYCSDKNCDCQRVFLNIASRKKQEIIAVVTYGWETEAFYQKWFGGGDSEMSRMAVKEMVGLGLNFGSPQSKYAKAALKLVENVLQDPYYVERIKRHYKMFKEAVDGTPKPKKVPAIPKILQALNQRVLPATPVSKPRKRHRSRNTDN